MTAPSGTVDQALAVLGQAVRLAQRLDIHEARPVLSAVLAIAPSGEEWERVAIGTTHGIAWAILGDGARALEAARFVESTDGSVRALSRFCAGLVGVVARQVMPSVDYEGLRAAVEDVREGFDAMPEEWQRASAWHAIRLASNACAFVVWTGRAPEVLKQKLERRALVLHEDRTVFQGRHVSFVIAGSRLVEVYGALVREVPLTSSQRTWRARYRASFDRLGGPPVVAPVLFARLVQVWRSGDLLDLTGF